MYGMYGLYEIYGSRSRLVACVVGGAFVSLFEFGFLIAIFFNFCAPTYLKPTRPGTSPQYYLFSMVSCRGVDTISPGGDPDFISSVGAPAIMRS